MALEDVYLKIEGFTKVLAVSDKDNSGGTEEERDAVAQEKETKTASMSIDGLTLNDTISISFDTIDATANNELQGTFTFSCDNPFIQFKDVESGNISSTHLLPEEPTVQDEITVESKEIQLVSSLEDDDPNIKNKSFKVIIDFSGTVEILNPGFDKYAVVDCCPCIFLPYIDQNNCEEYCNCPDPPECDNGVPCPCDHICDTSFFESENFTNGEGQCVFGCNTVDDCCPLTEAEEEEGLFLSCKEGKCVKDKAPTNDDDDDPDPDPDPDEDPDDFLFGVDYMFAQKISFTHTKTGHDFVSISNRDGMDNHTDQTLVFKKCITVDVDENEDGGIALFNNFGKAIQPFRILSVNDQEGIVNHGESFTNVFASMRGTDFAAGQGVLDSIQFSSPLRSSDLATKLRVALRQRSFTRERVAPGSNVIVGNAIRNFTFDEDGNTVDGGLQNTQDGLTNVNSSFGINGRQEKIRFYFAKKIETSTASSPDFASAEQRGVPVTATLNLQYDTISISEKDSYVAGRTTNENFASSSGLTTKQFPYLITPFATKVINKTFTSNSGTKFIKQVMEKILVTAGQEIATYDYGDTAVRIGISGGTLPALSTWNPIFLFSNGVEAPFNVDQDEDDDDDDDDDPTNNTITPTDEEAEEQAEEEQEASEEPCPESYQLPNAVEAI